MDLKEFLRQQWDRVAAWISIALGGLFLLLGWLGVSDTVFPAEQLPYILSGGLVGACFVGIGAMLWLSADLRDEWTELHEIARHLEAAGARDSLEATPTAEAPSVLEPVEPTDVEPVVPAPSNGSDPVSRPLRTTGRHR